MTISVPENSLLITGNLSYLHYSGEPYTAILVHSSLGFGVTSSGPSVGPMSVVQMSQIKIPGPTSGVPEHSHKFPI